MGSIIVDSDKANKGLEDTEKKAGGLADKLKSGAGKAIAFGGALGAGAIAGAGALFGMAKNTADATDRIDKLSQKIGISRTGFQELEYVLSQNGTDIEKLQVGLKTMTQRMGEATEGTGKGAEAFAKLGISATDSTGAMKSQEQMFEESAKALMLLPEGAEKSQMAFDMFGKAGLELMPMLNGTAEGFDELKQGAHDMGLVLSDDTVASGAQFTDTMDNIQRSMGAVMSKVGAEVMPIIQNALDWVLDHMPEIQQVVGTVFDAIGKFVKVASDVFNDYLMPVIMFVVDWIVDNWDTISETVGGVFNSVVEILEGFISIFQSLWDTWGDTILLYLEVVWTNIKNATKLAFDFIKDLLDVFAKLFKGDWSGLWEAIKTLLSNLWNNMTTLIGDNIKNILVVITNIGNKIKTFWSTTWENIKAKLANMWNDMVNNVKTKASEVWQSVKDMARDMVEALKNLPRDALQAGKDFVSGLIKGITGGVSELVNSAKNMANKAVDAVKNVFKIKSPSRVMMGIGDNVAEGLAVGIEDGEGMVNDAVDSMSSFVDKDIPIPIPRPKPTGGSGGAGSVTNAPVINIHIGSIKEDGDIRKLSRELGKTITQFNRTVGVID